MLHTYVDAWRQCAADTLALLDGLDDDAWARPTDLPGWTVADVAAHLAHLEAVLAAHVTDVVGEASGAPLLASDYTEAGVEERRGRSRADVVGELRAAVEARTVALGTLPEDARARATPTPASVPWTWDTLLRNRVVDLWCHEQDVRRAVDLPGDLDTPAATVTTHTFAAAMPYVLGKKVGAVTGTSVLWDLTGPLAMQVGASVGTDGRATPGVPAEPTVTLTMSSETFAVLAAGRRRPSAVEVSVQGSPDLGLRVLEQMTVTF